MNICNYLLDGKSESKPALLTLRAEYTYGQLRSAALSVAAFLVASGGKMGDRVLLIADSSFFWTVSYLGIIRAGMVCVPLPPGVSGEELQYVLSMTEPTFAFVESKISARLATPPNKPSLGTIPVISDSSGGTSNDRITLQQLQQQYPQNGDGSVPLPEVDSDALAALMFTSGSTGKPRGVMVSHRNIAANTDSIIEYLSLTSADRIMAVLPFHYCFGTSLLHTHLKVGGSVVIEPRFMYPEVVLQRMKDAGCTGFAGVPSHYQILLRRSNLAGMDFPALRYVQQAGGQLAPPFIQDLRSALPGKQIFIMYGQTEATARLSYLPPQFLDSKLGSVGLAIPGVRLSVIDESGSPVRPGETGEIVAEGENVCLGYWREEDAGCFRDGKLYTGDLATVDQDGFIYIVDRAKDFLKCGGKRVSARQLENILLENAELLEAAVIGVPDEVLGEAAVAYVVLRDPKGGIGVSDLEAHCRRKLPPAYVPKDFRFLRSLPKNSSGKVLKSALKNQTVPLHCG
ncbi:MAG TPA: AMP-binding protein [Candidatus Sulfotelmatobacter sp.]|nr:AMP-binding protein [Candidatus Sulfotelmatobacter sp.]